MNAVGSTIGRRQTAVARASVLALSLLVSVGAPGHAGAQGRVIDQTIQFFQSRAARDPDDFLTYIRLGAAYIQKARESGDVTYYDLAEKAVTRALELGPDPHSAATASNHLATVHYARHQFQDALAYAEKALAFGSGRRFPYAVVGDAYVEMGDYEKAAAAYAKLLGHSGAAYPHGRLSRLRFLRGDPQGAIQEMQEGVEAMVNARVPPENVAWTQVQLGELFFHVGDVGKAEAAHQDALGTYPGFHRALAGLARVRAAQRRYPAAIELYRKALGVIPLPEYAAALGDVYTKIGRAPEARKQYDLVEYIGDLNTLNKAIYNRELALFYADHDRKLPQALELAERELTVRRDIYTYDVLAWALYKNGKPREALTAMAEALKLGTKDARLLFHAGMIHQAAGDAEEAREHLRRALAINPHFHVLQADVAQGALKALGGRPGPPATPK